MGRSSACILVFLLTACTSEEKQTEAVEWKASYTDAECNALMTLESITQRCGGGDFERAGEVLRADPSLCLPYSAPQLLMGVWVRGFEYSEFFEGARTFGEVAERVREQDDAFTWFEATARADAAIGQLPPPDEGEAFRVEVIGKKSLCEGEYGHEGLATSEVLAQHLIGASPLQMDR